MKQQAFVFRDESGAVYARATKPAVLFTKSCGTRHKVGEYDTMLEYLDIYQKRYRQFGFHDIADDHAVMELPKDQEILDKVFQNEGFIKRFYEKAINQVDNGGTEHESN